MEKKLIYNGLCVFVCDNGLDFYDISHKKLNVCFNSLTGRSTVWLKDKNVYTYRLVAKAFPEICGDWFDGCEVHHLDGNPNNNDARNLRVLTSDAHHRCHIEDSISHLPEYKGQNDKPVYQYSLSGKFIKTWNSVSSAGRSLGIPGMNISKAARGESDTSGNYIWRYDFLEEVDGILSGKERTIIGNYTPVSKFTKSGEWISDYESLKAAAESVGVSHSGNIASCILGLRKSAYGYLWKNKNHK